MQFNLETIYPIVKEVKNEQNISPKIKEETLISYIKEGMYDINNSCGKTIDYSSDLKARSLLKNYVMYANYNKLAEFKELYIGEYAQLQAEYFGTTNL